MRMIRNTVWSAAVMLTVCATTGAAREPAKVEAKEEVAVWTFEAAAAALRHLPPGEHQITVLHPYTCCPVTVCFCLPCGCYELECSKGLCAKKLRFDFPGLKNDVVLKFHKNGDVSVKD